VGDQCNNVQNIIRATAIWVSSKNNKPPAQAAPIYGKLRQLESYVLTPDKYRIPRPELLANNISGIPVFGYPPSTCISLRRDALI
jgi:hypothetical protein